MSLETILAEDRVNFENKIIPLHDNPGKQYMEGIILFNGLIDSTRDNSEKLMYIKQRVNAFMEQLVLHKVCAGVGLHVLRATVSTEADYPGRTALVEYLNTFPRVSLSNIHVMDPDPILTTPRPESRSAAPSLYKAPANVDVDLHTLRQLKELCSDYGDWLKRMNAALPTANPKNHPNRNQLQERDSIRDQINTLATPDVIAKLVGFVMNERGVL